MKIVFALLGLLFCGPLWANDKDTKPQFTSSISVVPPVCEEDLQVGSSTLELLPIFRPENLALAESSPAYGPELLVRQYFTFSPDGKFVGIHHSTQQGSEQLTIRSTENGAHLSSMLWNVGSASPSELHSVAIDGEARRFAALRAVPPAGFDASLAWEYGERHKGGLALIPPPHPREYALNPMVETSATLRTQMSAQHPYYIRANSKDANESITKLPIYSVQILNWRTNNSLNVLSTSVDYLKVVREPISARFGYVAILRDDESTVQLSSFSEIERLLAKIPEPNKDFLTRIRQVLPWSRQKAPPPKPFNAPLRHTGPVRKVVLSKLEPIVVTQTALGLKIWNAETGDPLDEITAPMEDFRVLDHMPLIAFVDSSRQLTLYSRAQKRIIQTVPGFSDLHLSTHVENYVPGVAHIRTDDGSVFRITETRDTISGEATYEVKALRVQLLPAAASSSFLTEVQADKGWFLLHVYENHSKKGELEIDAYAQGEKGDFDQTWTFPIYDTPSAVQLSPLGDKVVYAADMLRTGVIDLERLLRENGF